MHQTNQFRLLRERRFLPFFLTQALGAFNDNVFKNALVLLIAYRIGNADEASVNSYANLAAGLFILPFFLFSASAGQWAEKYEKSALIRAIKLAEIAIMAAGAAALVAGSIEALLAVLFLMGTQSAVFGPVKYSILPQHLGPDELVGGNAWIEASTFLAILGGTVFAGILVGGLDAAATWIGCVVVVVAIAGYLAARAIPAAPPSAPDLVLNWNPFSETWHTVGFLRDRPVILNSVLGISWFWLYGSVFVTQLPNWTKVYLGGGPEVATLVLATFALGIGAGSLLCERLSGRTIEIGLVPLGSIGLTVFGVDLYFARPEAAAVTGLGALAFVTADGGLRILADLLLIGLFGGFFIVPLYALVQSRTERDHVSRVIAANNILNALFMVVAALLALALFALDFTIPEILLFTALLNAAVAVYIYTLVPEFLWRFVAWLLVSTLYRLRVDGREHIPEQGPALIVCNHVSFMDAVILLGAIRRPTRFVMYYKIFQMPLLNWLFRQARAIPIAGRKENPQMMERAFADVHTALAAGEIVGIFPEGGLTSDGTIQPFRPGVERILATDAVPVVPMALRGLWGSLFSRKERLRLPRRFRAKIALVIGAPIAPLEASAYALEQRVRELRGDWA